MNQKTKEFLTKLADLMQEYEATMEPVDDGNRNYPSVDGIVIETFRGWRPGRTEIHLSAIENNHEDIREQIK